MSLDNILVTSIREMVRSFLEVIFGIRSIEFQESEHRFWMIEKKQTVQYAMKISLVKSYLYKSTFRSMIRLDSFRKDVQTEKLFLPPFINEINLPRALSESVKNCKTVDRDKKRPWTTRRPEIERYSLIYGCKIQSVFETINQPSRKFAILFTRRDERARVSTWDDCE